LVQTAQYGVYHHLIVVAVHFMVSWHCNTLWPWWYL